MLLKKKFAKSEDAATPALEKVIGMRFTVASETSMGDIFDGGKVKEMSGGDPFQSRGNYGDFDKYWPSHTLFLLTNNPPHHPAEDTAFWHRMIKLSFEWSYVNNPSNKYDRLADNDLWDKLIADESRILGWLIRGGMIYEEEGLNVPESIRLESKKYQREEDDISDFIFEHCKQDEYAEVKATEIYNKYLEWFKENVDTKYEPKQANFGRKLSSRFERFKKGVYHYRGIRLLEVDEEPDKDVLMDQLDNMDSLNANSPEGEGE
jgi:putative DNA primase/helicase